MQSYDFLLWKEGEECRLCVPRRRCCLEEVFSVVVCFLGLQPPVPGTHRINCLQLFQLPLVLSSGSAPRHSGYLVWCFFIRELSCGWWQPIYLYSTYPIMTTHRKKTPEPTLVFLRTKKLSSLREGEGTVFTDEENNHFWKSTQFEAGFFFSAMERMGN